jgi:flagellar motor switch protein FliN/FliY
MADDASNMSQDEIDAQFRAAMEAASSGSGATEPSEPPAGDPPASSPPTTNDDSALLDQDETDALLRAAGLGGGASSAPPAAQEEATAAPAGESPPPSGATSASSPNDSDIQALLNQAEAAIASVDSPVESSLPGLSPYELRDLTNSPVSTEKASLELLRDVELDLRIELGRTLMYLEDVLQLRKGSVVPLDKLAGDPVDVYVNGRLVARGEILVLNDNFCVRVAELIAAEETC